MKIWAVANQKGGVGKTTTSVSLAGHLAREGKRVLLVDLDPHGSMTVYFGMEPEAPGASVYSLFKSAAEGQPLDPARVVHPTAFDGIGLMPASTALATLDRQLGMRDGMGLVLKRSIDRIRDDYDYVLIDCPPILGVTMVNALALAEFLIVPVQTEFLALKGLERMLRTLAMVQRSRRDRLEYVILPTMFDRRTRASHDTLRLLHDRYHDDVWPDVIPIDTQFREASRQGKPLPMIHPDARGSEAYRQFLHWLEAHVGGQAMAPAAELGASGARLQESL